MEFYVKNGASAVEFFNQNALEKPNDKQHDPFGDGPNVYYLMKDKILIKNTGEINVGDKVNFELKGQERNTGKALKNKYVYLVNEHERKKKEKVLESYKIVVE